MAIDDLADRVHDCNVLLDQNLYRRAADRYVDLVPEQSTQLLGPGYALLQKEYAALRPQAEVRSGYIGRVIIYFGGFNEGGLTFLCTRLLLEKDSPDLYVNVVLNKQHPDYEALEGLAGASSRCSLHSQVPSLASLMLDSDLAIGASGATSWERCCLGLPSLVVPLSENQRSIARDLEACGYVQVIGDVGDKSRDSLIECIKATLSSPLDAAWSEHCFSLVDGLGAYRVANTLGFNIEN
jgi:UDP-2,4-diacetamido-2,4,6-trideoxy-beta-L-altropyranose hydrolase